MISGARQPKDVFERACAGRGVRVVSLSGKVFCFYPPHKRRWVRAPMEAGNRCYRLWQPFAGQIESLKLNGAHGLRNRYPAVMEENDDPNAAASRKQTQAARAPPHHDNHGHHAAPAVTHHRHQDAHPDCARELPGQLPALEPQGATALPEAHPRSSRPRQGA